MQALHRALAALEAEAKQLETQARQRGRPQASEKEEKSLWDEVKGVLKDVYEGGKTIAQDLGISISDLAPMLLAL